MAKKGDIVAGVDFGGREVRVMIVQQQPNGMVRLLGHGTAPSKGCVRQGFIQNSQAAQAAFSAAMEAAGRNAQLRVQSVFCGVNAPSAVSSIREGKVATTGGVVELENIDEARSHAEQGMMAPAMRALSSVTSQEWLVDGLQVADPLGIRGGVLHTRMHFAQVPEVVLDNLRSCIEAQDCVVEDMVYMPIASALGCMTPEDMQLGTAVVDFGDASTSVAVYRNGCIMGTKTFEFGAALIINDLAGILKVPFDEAFALLEEYGVGMQQIRGLRQDAADGEVAALLEKHGAGAERGQKMVKLNKTVGGAPDHVPLSTVEGIIFARAKQLMEKVSRFLIQHQLRTHLVRGLVLTGGGAGIRNIAALAEAVCDTNVRIGLPEGVEMIPQSLNIPSVTPVAGVVRHGLAYRAALHSGRIDRRAGRKKGLLDKIIKFLKKWFF